MSNVIDQKKKPTTTVNKYTVAVCLDNVLVESFALEGVENTGRAFEGFLRWYLYFRSKNFPSLRRDHIDGIVETAESLSLPENSNALGYHSAIIDEFNEAGEVISTKRLTVLFSPFQFGMLFSG